jgi:hypothetical protein
MLDPPPAGDRKQPGETDFELTELLARAWRTVGHQPHYGVACRSGVNWRTALANGRSRAAAGRLGVFKSGTGAVLRFGCGLDFQRLKARVRAC